MQAEARGIDGSWWTSGALALEPEIVLPEQLLARVDPLNAGEMRLLWAVLMDGIATFCIETISGRTAGPTYREVERWIFGPDLRVFTSFRALCEVFRIDPRRLRRALERFREQPQRTFLDLIQSAETRAR